MQSLAHSYRYLLSLSFFTCVRFFTQPQTFNLKPLGNPRNNTFYDWFHGMLGKRAVRIARVALWARLGKSALRGSREVCRRAKAAWSGEPKKSKKRVAPQGANGNMRARFTQNGSGGKNNH
jgi:hypothetical protein